ncbi:core histone H2A/H2B/H3/H4 [Dictyocaulus viviparus]|uniref:Core histone H2A/H2B/H3/H4 n=1 Tax=Dictyocaulus viviparus TaxID=29172 RepID=A0A0D8Y2N2_DICVI|nr:core histone H2A/H2B/H3/H4 [Dictyocaulus viviparus]
MVRVKSSPENLSARRRITMRETTREIIHEISAEDDHIGRNKDAVGITSYADDNQYAVQYPLLPLTNRSNAQYQHYVNENRNPNLYSKTSQNEYMTSQQDYSEVLESQIGNANTHWNYRIPLQKRQVNEYMTEPEISERLESSRDSTTITHSIPRIRNENVPRHRIGNRIDRHMSADGEEMVGFLNRKKTHTGSNMEHINVRTTNDNATSSLGTSSLPFQRVVREVAMDLFPNHELRFALDALEALREASEAFIIHLFDASCTCALHARRVTVKPVDFHLVRLLQKW